MYFWEYQLRNETERLRTLFLPELGVKLKNLTGYTTYMIGVAAFNAAGDGPRSLPTRGRTQQAGESQRLQLGAKVSVEGSLNTDGMGMGGLYLATAEEEHLCLPANHVPPLLFQVS